MAIYENNLPLIIQHFTDREIDWIYDQLRSDIFTYLEGIDQKKDRLREYMHRNQKNYEQIRQLQLESNSYLLIHEELEWMENTDKKFLFWLKIKLQLHKNGYFPRIQIRGSDFPDDRFRNTFIYHLDSWSARLQAKRNFLNTLRSDWSKQQQLDKKQAWLCIENTDQTAWAWEYIQENINHDFINYPSGRGQRNPFGGIKSTLDFKFNPTTPEETYFCIFASFYDWPGEPAALREIQAKMKQAWAQQKYRASLKDRKQSTFVLSVKAKSQLQELAKTKNVNLNQMLEHIIYKEYAQFKENSGKKLL